MKLEPQSSASLHNHKVSHNPTAAIRARARARIRAGVRFVELSRGGRGAPGAHSPWAMIRCAVLELTPPWPAASSERGSVHCMLAARDLAVCGRTKAPTQARRGREAGGFGVSGLRYRIFASESRVRTSVAVAAASGSWGLRTGAVGQLTRCRSAISGQCGGGG